MDPITAFFLFATKLIEFMIMIGEGQTPDQKKQIWDWYIADQKRWRKHFKIDD